LGGQFQALRAHWLDETALAAHAAENIDSTMENAAYEEL